MTDIIKQDNDTYHFSVTINDTLNSEPLTFANIGLLEYTNEMNKLYVEGSMEYTDTELKCDKFLESQLPMISFRLEHIPLKSDGGAKTESSDDDISQTFVINGIEILEHGNGYNKYKFHFISKNYVNLNYNVQYTNYGKKKDETVTSIIKDILVNHGGYNVDQGSFESYNTAIVLPYISNANDNIRSSIDYLMNKLLYSPSLGIETGMKGLVYDEKNDIIRLYFMSERFKPYGLFTKEKPINITSFTNESNILYTSPTNIGYMANSDRLQGALNMKRMYYHTYNILSNTFDETKLIEDTQIVDYCNSDFKGFHKYAYVKEMSNIKQDSTAWNNDTNYYKDMFEMITQSNGLIVNQSGVIGTCPGWSCDVTIPNPQKAKPTQQKTENQYEKDKMQTITGSWDIYRVQHFINPQKQCFRQKLSLIRSTRKVV